MTKTDRKQYRRYDSSRSIAYNKTVAMIEKRRAHKALIIRRMILAVLILMIFVLGIGPIGKLFSHNSGIVNATENLGSLKYKIINIEDGDTLWSIAKQNMTIDYDSIYDYIDEIRECNQLETDCIKSGGSLMVPYYDGQVN